MGSSLGRIGILILMIFGSQTSCTEKEAAMTVREKKVVLKDPGSQQTFMVFLNKSLMDIDDYRKINPVLKALRGEIQKNIKEEPALNLYLMGFDLLQGMEGIVWRMGEWIGGSDALYVAGMNILRTLRYNAHLYGPHVLAVYEYLNLPVASKPRFRHFTDIQGFLTKELQPIIENSITQLNRTQKEWPENHHFRLNMGLFSGKGAFLSKSMQSQIFIKAHLEFLKAGLQFGGFLTQTLSAYRLDELLSFNNLILKQSFVNNAYRKVSSLLVTDALLIKLHTTKELRAILDRSEFKRFLTLNTNGETYLKKALDHLGKSNLYMLQGFKKILAKKAIYKSDHLINVNRILAIEDNIVPILEKRQKLFAGSTAVYSEVTGQKVAIDIKMLFKPKEDLKAFYPNKFVDLPEGYKVQFDEGMHKGKEFFVWHYEYGRPTAWPDPTFDGFIAGTTNKDIYEVMRTITLTPSTAFLSWILPVPGVPLGNWFLWN
jgi:hypothetical protein